ncbi:hypothetical protein [Actinophytocola oryzae]|uniref:Uncharacterized protein n=1 Tax=Actinophytocola oryzae TaxID=502181 RepID=A0A4R7VJR4_9PSEU|nr:hypothetical protein [Actinophytocola oryzae]TDV49684.1 hypothetical protein CLV71_10723 [Actinophytocola oryzae]
MRNLGKPVLVAVFTAGLALLGAMGATVSSAAAETTSAVESVAGQAPASTAAETYMGSTRDLAACHSTGLWYVTNGYATYYYCKEYYDAATGRWYALYIGV